MIEMKLSSSFILHKDGEETLLVSTGASKSYVAMPTSCIDAVSILHQKRRHAESLHDAMREEAPKARCASGMHAVP